MGHMNLDRLLLMQQLNVRDLPGRLKAQQLTERVAEYCAGYLSIFHSLSQIASDSNA